MTVLQPSQWRPRRAAFLAELAPFASAREARRSRHESHPVDDFLFDYYAMRPAQLRRWSPGPGVVLLDAWPSELDHGDWFIAAHGGLMLPPFRERRRVFLDWLIDYLTAVAERPLALGCFGMHEWAMVYRTDDVRHASTPMRLSPAAVAEVIESTELRCTHFDAFRFFTPVAVPRNRISLTRATTIEHDQPGCVHVTMDLFRYALKLAPWCPDDLFLATFHLARAARQIDMRASPYDLARYGLTPIPVEIKAGRDEYVAAQRDLAGKAEPVRGRLMSLCRRLSAELARDHDESLG